MWDLTPNGLRTAVRGVFSDLPGGQECEDIWVYTPKGLRTAEGGVSSDLSGGHKYEEYFSSYSQGTENCRGGSILWPIWRSWLWRIYEFILPRDWGLQRGEYFLTYLEVMNMKNIWVYTPKRLRTAERGVFFWPVWRSWTWRIFEFILPRDWGLQRGEYFLTSLEFMNVKNIWVNTPKGLRTAERGVFSDLSGGHECEIFEIILPRDWGLQRGEYFLTCLEVINVKNIFEFILPRDWELQRGEYFLNYLEVMTVKNIWVYTPKRLRTAERGVLSDLSRGYE